MTHVATLIAGSSMLPDAAVDTAAAVLPNASRAVWLEEGVAADVFFVPPPGASLQRWTDLVRNGCSDASCDVVVQPQAGRRKRLLVADMDSTIIEQECIDELAQLAGVRDEVVELTARSVRGEVAFEASLLKRVELIGQLPVATALKVADRLRLKSGAGTLTRTMRAHGAASALISGGFTLFTAHVARMAGFDRHFGNVLEVENGRLTGRLRDPLLGRASKRAILRSLRAELKLEPEATLAVGDGANDLAMLEEAGLGVAFHAKPAIASVARARLDHCDLTALLYVQGYRRTEFVA